MTRLTVALCVMLCAACAPADDASLPEWPPATDPTPSAPALEASALSGTWDFEVVREDGDTIPGFRLTATPDPANWSMQFEGRDPLPVRVSMAGDSVVQEFGPYESVLRPEVMVTATVVSRLVEDRLEGTLVARYVNAGPDSIMRATAVGRRTPP